MAPPCSAISCTRSWVIPALYWIISECRFFRTAEGKAILHYLDRLDGEVTVKSYHFGDCLRDSAWTRSHAHFNLAQRQRGPHVGPPLGLAFRRTPRPVDLVKIHGSHVVGKLLAL